MTMTVLHRSERGERLSNPAHANKVQRKGTSARKLRRIRQANAKKAKKAGRKS